MTNRSETHDPVVTAPAADPGAAWGLHVTISMVDPKTPALWAGFMASWAAPVNISLGTVPPSGRGL